jgi:hypothetical protein
MLYLLLTCFTAAAARGVPEDVAKSIVIAQQQQIISHQLHKQQQLLLHQSALEEAFRSNIDWRRLVRTHTHFVSLSFSFSPSLSFRERERKTHTHTH